MVMFFEKLRDFFSFLVSLGFLHDEVQIMHLWLERYVCDMCILEGITFRGTGCLLVPYW